MSYSILVDVERHRLIALIDAEIERLQQARLLIAPSVVSSRLRSQPPKATLPLQAAVKKHLSRTLDEISSLPFDVGAPQEQQAVSVTRIPARERSRSRSPRRAKQTVSPTLTALTADVPLHPVAAPAKRGEETKPEKPSLTSAVDSLSVSSFGQAISRGLASLNR